MAISQMLSSQKESLYRMIPLQELYFEWFFTHLLIVVVACVWEFIIQGCNNFRGVFFPPVFKVRKLWMAIFGVRRLMHQMSCCYREVPAVYYYTKENISKNIHYHTILYNKRGFCVLKRERMQFQVKIQFFWHTMVSQLHYNFLSLLVYITSLFCPSFNACVCACIRFTVSLRL